MGIRKAETTLSSERHIDLPHFGFVFASATQLPLRQLLQFVRMRTNCAACARTHIDMIHDVVIHSIHTHDYQNRPIPYNGSFFMAMVEAVLGWSERRYFQWAGQILQDQTARSFLQGEELAAVELGDPLQHQIEN